MVEVEEWLRFTDVFSAWLALIDESYVNELKLCRGYATEINQSNLAPAIAARSAKVFTIFSSALRSGTEVWNSYGLSLNAKGPQRPAMRL